MDRRKAIKRISLSFGSMTVSTGLISIVQSCQSDDSLNNLKFFNTTQISFLDRVLEIILPETETPGAISLNLSKFVDAYVSKNIKSEDQKYLFALIDEFISMIVKSENINSIDQVNDEIIEKYFSDHLDSGSMKFLVNLNFDSKVMDLSNVNCDENKIKIKIDKINPPKTIIPICGKYKIPIEDIITAPKRS